MHLIPLCRETSHVKQIILMTAILRTFSALVVTLVTGSFYAAAAQAGGAGSSGFPWLTMILIFALVAAVAVFLLMRFRGRASGDGKNTLGLAPAAENGLAKRNGENVLRPPSVSRRVEVLGTAGPELAQRARIASNNAASLQKTYVGSSDISDLPIARLKALEPPAASRPLPFSDDEDLLNAIEELQDDSESEAEFRLIALRVLATFKTANSVEALSQIALYDLSSTLRCKAVLTLADLNHDTVFDTIVLAAADPTREVRAAAARALVNLTLDRAEAWARLVFSNDQMLSKQIARAAVEAGLAERSFERLAIRDEKAAYEAFALIMLLIKTEETEKVFDAIANHRDVKTRIALLHIVEVAREISAIPRLEALIDSMPKPLEVAVRAREIMRALSALTVV